MLLSAAILVWGLNAAQNQHARSRADEVVDAVNRFRAREGRYPSGSYLPELSRGIAAFERGDFSAAIDALAPLAGQNERIGGSRAQHDLIDFTLLRAYLGADRLSEARQLLSARRPGAKGIAVAGLPQDIACD